MCSDIWKRVGHAIHGDRRRDRRIAFSAAQVSQLNAIQQRLTLRRRRILACVGNSVRVKRNGHGRQYADDQHRYQQLDEG